MEFFQFTSTWLVVALTWARLFAMLFPLGIAGFCRHCSASTSIVLLTCVSFVVSLTKLHSGGKESKLSLVSLEEKRTKKDETRELAAKIRANNDHRKTRILLLFPGYETDSIFEFVPCQEKIKPWGHAMYFYIALSTWLPLVFIFIANILLIFHMRRSERIHYRLTSK